MARGSRTRGTIEARGAGKWLVRVYIGRDGAGKRMYKSQTVPGTKQDAKEALTAMLGEKDGGLIKVATRETVGEFVARYLRDVKAGSVEAVTLRGYTDNLRRHIAPRIGHIRLDRLDTPTVQTFITALRTDYDLAPATVHHIHVTLHQALKAAVQWGIIPRNPASGIVLPSNKAGRRGKDRGGEARRVNSLSAEQVHHFLEGTVDNKYHALWYVLLHSGLRPGEAAALKWSDLWDDGRITVQRALTRVTSGRWEPVPYGKTGSAYRSFMLTKGELEVLRAHKVQQAKRMMQAGATFERNDLIFPSTVGTHLHLGDVSKAFKKAVGGLGMGGNGFTLYSCRHTAATLMLMAGVHPKAVSHRLGHSSITITLDTYSHVLPEVSAEAADTLERFMDSKRTARA